MRASTINVSVRFDRMKNYSNTRRLFNARMQSGAELRYFSEGTGLIIYSRRVFFAMWLSNLRCKIH